MGIAHVLLTTHITLTQNVSCDKRKCSACHQSNMPSVGVYVSQLILSNDALYLQKVLEVVSFCLQNMLHVTNMLFNAC